MAETGEPFRTDLIDKAEFLKDFTDRLLRDVNDGEVVQQVVLLTLIETMGKIVYQSGRYNQVLIGRSKP